MVSPRSLLDQVLGTDAAAKVGEFTRDRKSLAAGAAAGGLAALIFSAGKPSKLVRNALKVGGAALVGGLALRAWNDWQAGRAPVRPASGAALPPPDAAGLAGTAFLPEGAAGEALAAKLVRSMVAAAKADGHVTARERARILAQLPELGLGPEAERLIAEELDAPLDAGRIAALAAGPEEAAEIYAAALLVVDPDAPAEKAWMALLAARLGLDPGLVQHLHARAADLVVL